MAITSTNLTPPGVEFVADNATKKIELPSRSFRYGSTYSATNYELIHVATPLPLFLKPSSNRHTVAIDIRFEDDYLNAAYHGGVISRHSGLNYSGPGGNRSGAVIFGGLPGMDHAVSTEEIEISDAFTNVHHNMVSNLLQGDRWYRFAVDTIYNDGAVAIEARVWDLDAGNAEKYVLHTTISEYPHNWGSGRNASLFNTGEAQNGSFRFRNWKGHWSNFNEWVASP